VSLTLVVVEVVVVVTTQEETCTLRDSLLLKLADRERVKESEIENECGGVKPVCWQKDENIIHVLHYIFTFSLPNM